MYIYIAQRCEHLYCAFNAKDVEQDNMSLQLYN